MFKEILLKKEQKSIITKYGSECGESKPKVLYIRAKAKITPYHEKLTYECEIDKVKKQFMEYIDNLILTNKSFYNNHITSIDISSKSVKYGKTSFLRYDIYIKPILLKTIQEYQPLIEKLSIRLDKKLINLLEKYNIGCL